MPEIENDALVISIETNDAEELITLHFKSDDRKISIGFNIEEAQMLSLMLGETVTALLLKELQLYPSTPENIH